MPVHLPPTRIGNAEVGHAGWMRSGRAGVVEVTSIQKIPSPSMSDSIVVLGAGGRAGRAIVAEAISRAHRVIAVVRDPGRHADLEGENVTLAKADATDAAAVTGVAAGARAVVSAVAPFSGPPESFDGFDPGFFRRIAETLLAAPDVPRIVVVGLFATLADARGRLVMDDPSQYPPALLPYAAAQVAGIDRLREADQTTDWIVLTPPPALRVDLPRSGRYKLGGRTLDVDRFSRLLGYADLAVAAIDEIERPSHRGQVAVYDAEA